MLQLGNVQIDPPVLLAPMSGVTDAPFRAEAVRFGAPAVVTEMVAGDALAGRDPEHTRRAERHDGPGPFILQLAAREPDWVERTARFARDAGVDVLDLNMGCPAKRVTGGLAGAALMREPLLVARLVAAAKAAFGGPVTAKMRLGWDDQNRNASEVARICEGEGACMITVHGRTRCQFYSGEASWDAVAPVVAAVRAPVIVNGDITDATSARRALALSGASGVMIGRAAVGRPWLVGAVAAGLSGRAAVEPSWGEKTASIVRQVEGSIALYGDSLGVRVVRKHIAGFIDTQFGHQPPPQRKQLRSRLCAWTTAAALVEDLRGLEGRAMAA